MPLYSLARGFLAVEDDLEATFEIRDRDVRVEVRRLGEVVLTLETWISEPCAANKEGFFFAVCSLAYCSQLVRDPDALRALAEAASGYEKYDPCGDCSSEYRDLMSDEDVAKSSYAIGFAAGVDVALGLAGRITDGEGE